MTAPPARRPAPPLATALFVLAGTAACGGERHAPPDSAAAAVEIPAGSAGVAELPGGAPGPTAGDTAGPLAGGAEGEAADSLPPLPGEEPPAEAVTYRLLLVNANADSAVVHASAGAGRVVLDTVPGRDSVRVNVRLRSDRIQLEAVAPDGEPFGAMELLLEADTLNRWELPSVARGVETHAEAVHGRLQLGHEVSPRARPGRPPRWDPAG